MYETRDGKEPKNFGFVFDSVLGKTWVPVRFVLNGFGSFTHL